MDVPGDDRLFVEQSGSSGGTLAHLLVNSVPVRPGAASEREVSYAVGCSGLRSIRWGDLPSSMSRLGRRGGTGHSRSGPDPPLC